TVLIIGTSYIAWRFCCPDANVSLSIPYWFLFYIVTCAECTTEIQLGFTLQNRLGMLCYASLVVATLIMTNLVIAKHLPIEEVLPFVSCSGIQSGFLVTESQTMGGTTSRRGNEENVPKGQKETVENDILKRQNP
ncbi:hypothetical protein D5086_015877, partial [Populus alba]